MLPETIRLNIELQGDDVYGTFWKDQAYLSHIDFANRKPLEKGVEWVEPVGTVQAMEYARNVKAPISIFEDFKNGGTDMQIPQKLTDFGPWIYGDKTVKGSGYVPELAYRTLRVNAIAKAKKMRQGFQSEQVYLKFIKSLVNNAKPELSDQMGMYMNAAGVKHTLFYGADHALCSATTDGGRAVTKKSHPNIFVPGSGWIGYTVATDTYTSRPGTDAYELAVEAALNSLVNTSTYKMSLSLVDKIMAVLPHKRIMPPIMLGGRPFYFMYLTTAQAFQLRQDANWKTLVNTQLPRETDPVKNWQLQGALGFYGSIIFKEDILGWGAHTNTNANGWVTAPTAGHPGYGPEDLVTNGQWGLIKNLDASPYQAAVILGQRAIDCGIAKRAWFDHEEWDYKRKQEMAIQMLGGMELANVYDTDNFLGNGVGAFVEHTGSALVFTYSDIADIN